MADASNRFLPLLPTNLAQTTGGLMRGPYDPSVRMVDGALWRACMTPMGPATTCIRGDGGHFTAEAWGTGAEWAVAHAPELLGSTDSLDGFAPQGKLKELHRRNPGLRIPRTRAVYEALLRSVLEQRVQGREAMKSHTQLVKRFGLRAPGPMELYIPPQPDAVMEIPSYDFVPMGVERKRAVALHSVARRAAFANGVADLPNPTARQKLELIDGVGVWTAAEVALTALGDADAVPVGDYHAKNLVSFAFTGEPRGDDARMLELLAPYAGHRGRVLMLMAAAGIQAPRFGPRRPLGLSGM